MLKKQMSNKMFYIFVGIVALAALFIVATGGHKNTRGDIIFLLDSSWGEAQEFENLTLNISELSMANKEDDVTVLVAKDSFDVVDTSNPVLISGFETEENIYNKLFLGLDIQDASEEYEFYTPMDKLSIEHEIEIKGGTTTVLEISLSMNESLFASTDGEYVFLPVIEVKTITSASVSHEVKEDHIETNVRGGSITETQKLRVDANGNLVDYTEIDARTIFEILEDGSIEPVTQTPADVSVNMENAIEIVLENTEMSREDIKATNLREREGNLVWHIDGLINEVLSRVIVSAESGEVIDVIAE